MSEDNDSVKDRNLFERGAHPQEVTIFQLRRLSHDWTSTAIGFFEIIPEFNRRHLEYVSDEMVEKVMDYLAPLKGSPEKTVTDEGETVLEYKLELDELGVIAKILGKTARGMSAATTMSHAALGALISEYEAFTTNLLRALAKNNPSIFISDDETISIRSLEAYSTYEEFIDDLLDEKISNLLQEKSHQQLLHWINERFGVNLTSDEVIIAEFVEICQRRHLISHAGGKVNKKYLKICKEAGNSPKNLPAMGETIRIDRKYLRRATARIYQVGFFTLHILWQKLFKESKSKSLSSILESSHDFLDSNLTKMTRRTCEFVLNSKSELNSQQKAYFAINLAQSYLFCPLVEEENRSRKVEAALRRHDWSITSPIINLALCCLRRDWNNLDRLTEKAVAEGLNRTDALTWSIFREAREQEEFKKHFEA